MYSIFKVTGHKLPSINTQASLSMIQEWKSAADNGVTNNGRPNDDAANDGIADNDILSSDSYNTEEDGQYVNSLIENYELRKK
ncbi:15519_t:CDS:2 [Rhizophagus irregularis]|nr:15519_t:CDS:2 [Rhizophagus irregularis]